MSSLVYKSGTANGSLEFMTILDTLLTNSFSSVEPRGLGWTRFFDGGDSGIETSLNGTINNSVQTIIVLSTAGFNTSGTIIIDSEQISYTSITSTAFNGCLRGANNTTADVHFDGTVVDSISDKLYFSLGSSQSERIWLRLTGSLYDPYSNAYIDRTICQYARSIDGYMLSTRGDINTRIDLGFTQFEYWIVGNQDFIHLVVLVGSTYSHYYCGIINRFAPNQNSSLYGQSSPIPVNTTVPLSAPFTVATGTTLFLRIGFDAYGGYGANNLSFYPGQMLYIIDQSLGTTTVNHQGVVILNSVDTVLNSINVTYVSGDATFSSFSIISIDPQPNALSANGVIRGSSFLMLDDFAGEATPLFDAVDEFAPGSGLPPEGIQNPNSRGVYLTTSIRLYNTEEERGTLYGSIAVPVGAPGAQDFFQTFDGIYKFMLFPDGPLMLAIGSII